MAITVGTAGTSDADIWILEVTRGLRTRFTFAQGSTGTRSGLPTAARWLSRLLDQGISDLYKKSVDGAVGSEELLYADERAKQPYSWSPDGKYLLFGAIDPKTKSDLLILPMTGERKPFAFAQTEFSEAQGVFSPDGRWIAYVSDESGTAEVYAAPFPGPGGKRLISTRQAGSRTRGHSRVASRWQGDFLHCARSQPHGRRTSQLKGTTLEAGLPRVLFGPILGVGGRNYAVSADGKRFLTLMRPGRRTDAPITLIQNWRPEAKK